MGKNISCLYSAELYGIDARIIEVEADVNVGLHSFEIVGLADRALNEARERVNSALKNSGVKPPNRENRKITINLAPADVRKTGTHYDLGIALAYLLATAQIKSFDGTDKIFLGELALDGRLRPVRGALNIAQRAGESKFKYLFLPEENANEAAATPGIKVIPLKNLRQAIAILNGDSPLRPHNYEPLPPEGSSAPDLSEIKGQGTAKRALTIAAAGMHNLLFVGQPGVGKSFLASALSGILPDLTTEESIEVTKIWSSAKQDLRGLIRTRPFRAPHHTISAAALIGGGTDPKPGEISMAHRGVLFLDELPEFDRETLEALRQPLESGIMNISRAKKSLIFPAKMILVAAMNPCPCGYFGAEDRECRCKPYEIMRYQKKISGPLLDRIDMRVRVGSIKIGELREESSEAVSETATTKKSVEAARLIQGQRFSGNENGTRMNGEMTSKETHAAAAMDHDAETLLTSIEKSTLSPRGYYRLLKVARTIADLDQKEKISAECLAEAWSYRMKEEI